MPPKTSVKGRLARAFLSFLDEHGDYRTQLEEAAARAAAAEANALYSKDRRGRKKKRRRGKLKDGEEEIAEGDEAWEELFPFSSPELDAPPKHPQLPEDPYEQIQFYFHTFTHRTKLQLEEKKVYYQKCSKNWMHDELHHPARVPLLSGVMLGITCLLCMWRARQKKIAGVARWHGILGKKLQLKDYLHKNIVKGRLMLRYSEEGKVSLGKLRDKAQKAEAAALASMRPYQRKKYERFCRLEKVSEWCVTGCLLLGMLASGVTLGLSLNTLLKGDLNCMNNNNATSIMGGVGEGERLDGHIYSLEGPTDSDGYPIGMRELAEENYAACLADAESQGIEDPTTVCNVNSFFDAATAGSNGTATINEEVTFSPLRSKINIFLTTKLHIPPSLANYLTTLGTQTICYLFSLLTFILFLSSHYVAHKIHLATMQNDPMKHFVLSATDKTVKADGTVEAKKGESEAQRKKRERMLQNERLKAQMAQLAMEAKQRVAERRVRMEAAEAAAEAATKEKGELSKKEMEEEEETVECHSRQFGMLKMGVPEGAVLNSFAAEGIEDDEGKEIIEKLKAIKVRRVKEAEKKEEMNEKKLEDEKKADIEKDRIAAERLRMMKNQKGTGSSVRRMNSTASKDGGAESKKKGLANMQSSKSIDSASTIKTDATSKKSKPDPAMAKSAMLGQIGQGGGGLKKAKKDPAMAKSAMLGQIGNSSLEKASKIPSNPAPRPGSSTIMSGNLPIGAKSDKRWDRESKTWVSSDIKAGGVGDISPSTKGVGAAGGAGNPKRVGAVGGAVRTPKKSNKKEGNNADNATGVRKIPSRLKLGGKEEEEEKKGEIEEAAAAVVKMPRVISKTPPLVRKQVSELTPPQEERGNSNDSHSSSSSTPVLVRISSPDGETLPSSMPSMSLSSASNAFDGFRRPSARDIQARITAVENAPDEDEGENQEGAEVDLTPGWAHSPAFESAFRNSNASWDRRPNSRDVMARIQAVEEYEQQNDEEVPQQEVLEEDPQQAEANKNDRSRTFRQGGDSESLAIIDEGSKIDRDHATSFEFRRKGGLSRSGGSNASVRSDDEISELSEPTYLSSESNAIKGRSIPQALFVPSSKSVLGLSPMVNASPMNARRNIVTKDSLDKLARMAETGDLDLPTMEEGEAGKSSASIKSNAASGKSEEPIVKVETEEEKKRREKAEARMKKMEAISAKRNAGEEDDESAVSGLSKRHRMRRKKKATLTTAATLTAIASESNLMSTAALVKVETEAERQRKQRAEKRAKKLENMFDLRRNTGEGDDDDTTVTGISKRHRLRRKKSALAAISPEERERENWKKGIFASVLNAEQVQWKTAIYGHVINSEATRARNSEAKRDLDEQDAAVKRRLENQRRLDKRAKQFASRAERFHKIRHEDDASVGGSVGGSVVSSASKLRRRRRGRKSSVSSRHSIVHPVGEEETAVEAAPESSARHSLVHPVGEEETPEAVEAAPAPIILTAEEKEKQEREQWCNSVYTNVMQADQCQWKNNVYSHAIRAEEALKKRQELEAQIAQERAADEARREKERRNELRRKKMEKINQIRDSGGRENTTSHDADDDQSVATVGTTSSSMRNMRNRRRKAARKATPK